MLGAVLWFWAVVLGGAQWCCVMLSGACDMIIVFNGCSPMNISQNLTVHHWTCCKCHVSVP